jgi:tRNA modification GTPase
MDAQTIFALASGRGRAGIAIVRVSGPQAGPALERLAGRTPPPRRAARARIRDGSGELLDDGLILWFPAPASFTGEDVAELHVHGGRAVIDGLLQALGRCPGLRPADPGEFSRRAFANRKLDLTAAEGLADLIEAETAAQRRQALRQLQGELAGLYDGWRARLLQALAHTEAAIDFADEDLPLDLEVGVGESVQALGSELAAHLDDGQRGERLRSGIEIAIVGPPNAGKSSLLNALAGRAAAIVSAHPGTTRDVIEVALDLGGYPVLLADTAGVRDGIDEVEREGVARARARARTADIRLVVLDGALWPHADEATLGLIDETSIVVLNKADLLARDEPVTACQAPLPVSPLPVSPLPVSALTGQGMAGLLAGLEEAVAARFDTAAAPSPTRLRHRAALETCLEALCRAQAEGSVELLAENLRSAAAALGRITGRVDVEQVLDVIFRDFCIGK